MSFSIYHCGRCGSLFPAKHGHDEDRVCTVCKQRPGTGEWAEGYEDESGGSGSPESPPEATDGTPEGILHRGATKRKDSNPLPWVVAFWILLMGLALWMHRNDSARDLAERNRAGIEEARMKRKAAVLDAALPECHKVLWGFLNAGTLGERTKFVIKPDETAGKMAAFRGRVPKVDPARLVRVGQELIGLEGGWAVRTHWKEGADGESFDAVFRKESGAWLLDWEHFVGFSMRPWESFLAGAGPDEGEFRLYARLATDDDGSLGKVRQLRFVLLPPDAKGPAGERSDLPEFVVGRRSEEGLLLEAAFDAKLEGGGLFGGAMKQIGPDGLVRVRVVVERSDFGGVRKFEVVRIIACHWITSDAPGFDLGKLKEKAFGVN